MFFDSTSLRLGKLVLTAPATVHPTNSTTRDRRVTIENKKGGILGSKDRNREGTGDHRGRVLPRAGPLGRAGGHPTRTGGPTGWSWRRRLTSGSRRTRTGPGRVGGPQRQVFCHGRSRPDPYPCATGGRGRPPGHGPGTRLPSTRHGSGNRRPL